MTREETVSRVGWPDDRMGVLKSCKKRDDWEFDERWIHGRLGWVVNGYI